MNKDKTVKGQGYISNNDISFDNTCNIELNDIDKMIHDKAMYQAQGITTFQQYKERVIERENEIILKNENAYNVKLLTYPHGQQVTLYKKAIQAGIKNENLRRDYKNVERTKEQSVHNLTVSLNRTKNNIYNIARSYSWEWFITLTFNRDLTDASNYDLVVKKLSTFTHNLVNRQCPDLKYLIIPELHKDKENYHFHGLLANTNGLDFVFSGKFDKHNRPIFNISNWSWGFTTATLVGHSAKASNYITKYVTKDSERYLYGKHRYYSNCKKTQAEKLVVNKQDFLEMYADDISYMSTKTIKPANQIINYFEINFD